MTGRIAFQGEPGAYSHQACRETRPELEPLPCRTFEDVISAVQTGAADEAMLPVENTTYGRVADIHRLLPESGLHIVDEAFVRVHINLLAVPGARLEDIRRAHSHVVLLPQCGSFLREHGIEGVVSPDNARAAREVLGRVVVVEAPALEDDNCERCAGQLPSETDSCRPTADDT